VTRDSRPSFAEQPRALRKLYRALAAYDVDGDRAEAVLVRRLQFVMGLASMPMIGVLGVIYGIGGHWQGVAWSIAYIVATVVLVLALVVTGRFGVFRIPHVLVVGTLPVGLTIQLGGFTKAGGVMLWTLLVPIVATMFGFQRKTLYFLVAVIATIAVYATSFRDVAPVLSLRELEFHFAFNTIGFTMFLFVSVRYFVSRVEAEKARAEGLLARVLPAPIVRRLKRGQTVIADHLETVTVLFADIVGFTPLAAKLSPASIVELLDTIFTRFDALAAEHGVAKIKTIGDAYMAVAGAPERCPDHAERAARLALAMRTYVGELARERGIELSMRIGLHTGEVVAGVIGIQRFAYDLWGDTVNTASRMESHGQPGAIQLSPTTRDALGGRFAIRERGPIEVKGRGTIVTYWLDAHELTEGLRENPRS
jgi:adenylate cyclase